MVQVAAKAALAHLTFQVAVAGRDHLDIDLQRLLPAETPQDPVFDRGEQLGLQLQIHLADLVQEQGASIRLLQVTAMPPLGPGEGACLVAEQLGFQKIARQGRAIDLDQRTIGAGAGMVQDARRQTLAGTSLAAEDQGAERHLRQAAQQLPYALCRLAATEKGIGRVATATCLALIA